MIYAEWGRGRNGESTGEFENVDEQSLYRIAGDEYEAAYAAMAKPPHRWGEWAALFHPRFKGQIVGYRRLRPKEWFTFGKDSGEIAGPWPTKRHALYSLRLKSARTVESGVYETDEHYVFTRDRAERINLTQEDLL